MILQEILASTEAQLRERMRKRPLRQVEKAASEAEPVRGFARAVLSAQGRMALIGELKKASPSAGVIREPFEVAETASMLAEGGADCLSVLTEPVYFQGDLANLTNAGAVALPRLQKDFLLHEYQILEGRAAGADAVLLIAEALDARRARDLCNLALDLELDVLFEAHEPRNWVRVTDLAERQPERILVGINNRNLQNFEVSLEVSFRALRELPRELTLVSESGIRSAEDVVALRDAGARGILVGESLMRSSDVSGAARALLEQVRGTVD